MKTGSDGTFAVDELPSGRWRILVSSPGYLPMRALLDLSEGTEVYLSLVRQPASYSPSPFDLMPVEEPIRPDGMSIFDGD